MTTYAKAVWAFLSALVGALTTAVMAAPSHTFGGVQTLGWLGVATTVLLVTGGVYGLTNASGVPPSDPPPPPPVPVEQPGYQPDPQKGDDAAKALRLAHAQRVIADAAMSTATADLAMFRDDMHEIARRAAFPGQRRPYNQFLHRPVPSCGTPPV